MTAPSETDMERILILKADIMDALSDEPTCSVIDVLLAYGAEREAAGEARGRKEMREEAVDDCRTREELLHTVRQRQLDMGGIKVASITGTQELEARSAAQRIAALPDHHPAPTEGDAT